MKSKVCITLTALLCVTTNIAAAHPGPHTHAGLEPHAAHADLGWEALLILAVVAAAAFIWRRREHQH